MSTKSTEPCACVRTGSLRTQPCLTHYGALSEIDKRRIRAQLGIVTVEDRKRR